MGYTPKIIKCKINIQNIRNEEIAKQCACDNEISCVKKFYEKLDGAVLYLSLWDYDNHECYHLTGWDKDFDKQVMEAMFILESEFGVYSNFEEYKKVWELGEYDPGCSIVFPKNIAEELEVICEEQKEVS